ATTGPQPTSNQRTVRQPENAGPHHLSWSVSADAGNAGATNKAVGGRIVAMASGMNYWDGSRWSPSQPAFEPNQAGDAFVAQRVHHKTTLSAEINVSGAVTLTIGADTLRLSPVAIALYDAVSGDFAIIATITN